MGKQVEQKILKEKVQMPDKYIKKLFTILSHKKIANQNCTKIPPHPSQTCSHQENKHLQMLVRTQWVKCTLYTLSGSVK
jgi:hypothetical protein